MSYAMCLDNSWDVMCEEEMYDVNGGWGISISDYLIAKALDFIIWSVKKIIPQSIKTKTMSAFIKSTKWVWNIIKVSAKFVATNWKYFVAATLVAVAFVAGYYIGKNS